MNVSTPTEQTLENIKNAIEMMGKPQHIEILNMLKRNSNVKINENRNGVYVNLSYIPIELIDELEIYIGYIKDQELSLKAIEIEKEKCKTDFFSDVDVVK
jgi:hypothetical protein